MLRDLYFGKPVKQFKPKNQRDKESRLLSMVESYETRKENGEILEYLNQIACKSYIIPQNKFDFH